MDDDYYGGGGGYDAGPDAGYGGGGGGGGGYGGGTGTSPGTTMGGGPDTSPNEGGAGGGRGKRGGGARINRTVVPITIGTLELLVPNATNEHCCFPDPCHETGAPFPVHLVRIMGRITSISDEATCCSFTISDATGAVTLQHFTSEDDLAWANLRPKLQPHTYVEAVAYVKLLPTSSTSAAALDGSGGYDGGAGGSGMVTTLTLTSIKHVSNGNFVTMHMLDSLYHQAMITKGRLPPPAASNNAAASNAGGASSSGAGGYGTGAFGAGNGGGYGNRGQASGWGSNAFSGGGGGGGGGLGGQRIAASAGASGGLSCVEAVRRVFIQAIQSGGQPDAGFTAEELAAALNRQGWRDPATGSAATTAMVLSATEQLGNEGALFEGGTPDRVKYIEQ